MIYLIGGAPRVGKTTLANMILDRKHIQFIPADLLTHALDLAYPQLGIRANGWDTIPEKFYPYLRQFVNSAIECFPDYVIEGDSFLPEHVERLGKEFKIKSVFLGTSSITLEQILSNPGHDEWVAELPKEEQEALPEWIMTTSKMFEAEAAKYSIPYFDIAQNREQTLEAAYTTLFT